MIKILFCRLYLFTCGSKLIIKQIILLMKHNYFPQHVVKLYHSFKDEQRNVKRPPELQYKKQLAIRQFKQKIYFLKFRSKANHPLDSHQYYWQKSPRIPPSFN